MEPFANIILSNSVDQSQNAEKQQILNVVNPFVVINPAFFPTQYSFVITILVTGVDLTGKEQMGINIISPTKKVLFSTGNVPTPDLTQANQINNITLNFDLKNVILDEQGVFSVEFNFNNSTIASTKFRVDYLNKKEV